MLFFRVQDMPANIVIDLKSPNGQSGLHILNFGTFLQHANHIYNTKEFFLCFLMSGRYWIQEETAAIPCSELKSVTGEFT
jgi:hypothetical protein